MKTKKRLLIGIAIVIIGILMFSRGNNPEYNQSAGAQSFFMWMSIPVVIAGFIVAIVGLGDIS